MGPEPSLMFLGIDPGLSGAFAYLLTDSVQVFQLPTLTIMKNKKSHREYDIPALMNRLKDIQGLAKVRKMKLRAIIESVHSMKNQGVVSTFSFGKGFGIWLGVLTALNIPYELVTPQRWKKTFGLLGLEKNAAVEKVKELFKNKTICIYDGKEDRGININIDERLNHNHSDAILMAEYLRRILTTGQGTLILKS